MSPKRLGILTYHYSFNEGAQLQAFCLSHFLQSQLPDWEVELVDHRYLSKIKAYGQTDNNRWQTLDRFFNRELPLSPRGFYSNHHEKTLAYLNERYDAVIVGSDEIWKFTVSGEGEQTDPWCPAVPNVYWPNASVTPPKISYAISIGTSRPSSLPPHIQAQLAEILQDFTLISVRDDRTYEFVENLCPQKSPDMLKLPDPAFSIDLRPFIDLEALQEKLERMGVDFSKPTVFSTEYFTKNHEFLELDNYQLICQWRVPGPHVCISSEGLTPLEWAGIPYLVDAGITHRMHGTIIFLLANTPCIVLDSRPKTQELCRTFELPQEQQPLRRIIERWPAPFIEEKKQAYARQHQQFAQRLRSTL
jgi:hypothetical protein